MTINERIAAELTPRIIKFWGHTYVWQMWAGDVPPDVVEVTHGNH